MTQTSDFVKLFRSDFALICNENSKDSVEISKQLLDLLEQQELKGYLRSRDAKEINSLDQHFAALQNSKYILTIYDKDFKKDNFAIYTQETIFRTLVDSGELPRFIPIVIGVQRRDVVPSYIPNFCLEFGDNWQADNKQLERLKNTIQADIPPSMFGF
ncbi:unnamed protein product [Owenia fusiformis]|uniref:Uncharacterized protein n=1 Tax=Owenia fusiformis TaxID=6347 RepID=A0A8J1XZ50_OWEFU|nr:unnamed protein product [Owenia fusiformis]